MYMSQTYKRGRGPPRKAGELGTVDNDGAEQSKTVQARLRGAENPFRPA